MLKIDMVTKGSRDWSYVKFIMPDGREFKVWPYSVGPGRIRLQTDAPIDVRILSEDVDTKK